MESAERKRRLAPGSGIDVLLVIVIIVLVNIIGSSLFFRLDLTRNRMYSLSPASRTLVRSLQEPLSINVFFSRDLPAPYNSVDRYVTDLLAEYSQKANSNFSFEVFDMENEESKDLAQSLGISPVQIQEIKSDQLSARSVYMGLAVIYGDLIETIPQITSADGLEYTLTTLITKMAGKADALLGLEEKIGITLYASGSLKEFSISGFDTLAGAVSDLCAQINRENYNAVEYRFVDPASPEEVDALVSRYGLQKMTWRRDRSRSSGTAGGAAGGGSADGSAVLAVVVELGDRFRVVPLSLARQIFGGYQVTGLSDLGEKISDAIGVLVSPNPRVGYLTGHGERDLTDAEGGAAVFEALNSDLYEFAEIDLSSGEIPGDVRTLVINGPVSAIPAEQLFAIDQFLMAGGSLFVFLDSFREYTPPSGSQYQQSQPVYIPLDTGIDDLLASYGAVVNRDVVLDKYSYVARQTSFGGDFPIYYIPILERESINQEHPVTRNLAKIALLRSSSITREQSEGDIDRRPLLQSSTSSWHMEGRIDLTPYLLQPPVEDEMGQYVLAAALEGKFRSHFTEPPAASGDSAEQGTLAASRFIPSSIRPGRIVVVGTSELTTSQLIDPEGRSPNALFLRNAMDYLNENVEMIQMRAKGFSYNPLAETSPAFRAFLKGINIGGLPLLVGIGGLAAWRWRNRRRRRIKTMFEGAGADE